MKNNLLIILLLFVYWPLAVSQKSDIKKYQYESKFGNYFGKLDIKFWSGGIIEYSLLINNESGNPVFKQDGFAINKAYDEFKETGMLFGEQIGPDYNNMVPACSYFVESKCENWLLIKVSKDYSLAKINCEDKVLNQLNANQPDPEHFIHGLGLYYLKLNK